ncbi:MAG TPA: hypothetical protein PLK12_02095, partial [Prolixibacteraceae bacterium]|nr:hypothetical protein [Prolixibacteraceae bacterium]
YPIWIEKFIEPFPLIDKRSVIKRFVSDYQHEFVILGEDRLQHKRHVIPGDFRIKLKEKIIIELNNLFRDVLSVLGYDE